MYYQLWNEPFLNLLWTGTETSLNTAHHWSENPTVVPYLYAVSAVLSDGSETLISDMVTNPIATLQILAGIVPESSVDLADDVDVDNKIGLAEATYIFIRWLVTNKQRDPGLQPKKEMAEVVYPVYRVYGVNQVNSVMAVYPVYIADIVDIVNLENTQMDVNCVYRVNSVFSVNGVYLDNTVGEANPVYQVNMVRAADVVCLVNTPKDVNFVYPVLMVKPSQPGYRSKRGIRS